MAKLVLIVALIVIGWLWWQGRGSTPKMSSAEARALLEVSPDADSAAIRAAHRRIIARVHPDAGGTAELARRINQARDQLLAELDRRPPARS